MIVATAGHVDHGKTRLVRALTGVDTDRLAEEKRRGLSIEPGFAYCHLAGGALLGFVDVPGHQRFIHNMLACVAGVDLALLVVAADDGPMPQTHEHLDLLTLLGVPEVMVALSRIDRVDAPRRAVATAEVQALLAGGPFETAPVLPVSPVSGEGVEALRTALETRAAVHQRDAAEGLFRFAVDRSFAVVGAGVVVTGTVFAGRAGVGDPLALAPGGRALRLRGLQVAGQPADAASAGDRAALNLAAPGLAAGDLRRGDWVVAPPLAHASERLDARLRLLPSAPRPLRHWSELHLHLGAAHLSARVAVLGQGSIGPGEEALVQLVTSRPVHACRGDVLILRDQSARHTLAGGTVLDPLAPARGRARPERLALLEALARPAAESALAALVERSPHGVDPAHFARIANREEPGLASALAGLPHRRLHTGDGWLLVAESALGALRERLLAAVDDFHAREPRSQGPNLTALARLVLGGAPPDLLAAVATELVAEGRLARRGMLLHHPDHAVRLDPRQAETWSRAAAALDAAGGSAPSLHPLARDLALPVDELRDTLEMAVAAGEAARVARNRYLPLAAMRSYALEVESLGGERGDAGFSVAEFRDRACVGRNFAVDLLEFFDRSGLTSRHGEQRRLRGSAATLFGDERPGNR